MIDYCPIHVYITKIENKSTFKIKAWYILEFLTPEALKRRLIKTKWRNYTKSRE